MTLKRRLVVLGRVYGPTAPPGCRWVGGRCNAYREVRVAPDDPSEPLPAPATCARCGRPTFARTIVVVGGDAGPPVIPE